MYLHDFLLDCVDFIVVSIRGTADTDATCASFFYAAVKPAMSLNSREDRKRIHKPCGSHTFRKPPLPPPPLPPPPLPPPHHSKLADAPCD
jgi:hypothetical protein